MTNDAALLVLSQPTTAPAVTLAKPREAGELLTPRTKALLVGWGDIEPEQREATTILQQAETVVQSPAACKRNTRRFYRRSDICVINYPYFGTGICEGDSGGPLIEPVERSNGESGEVDIGIASHADVECSTNRPSVYTRVDAVYPWVHRWITALEGTG
jgi:secreted trypsin-like serine protease